MTRRLRSGQVRGRVSTCAILGAVVLSAATAGAGAATPSEDPLVQEYASRIEPICQANTKANHHILAGAQKRVNRGELQRAGKQFDKAAVAFAKSTRQIEAVPRPPAYEMKLGKWFEHLAIIDDYLKKISKALKAEDKLHATYEVVKLRSAAKAANNVVYDRGFHYCPLSESSFT